MTESQAWKRVKKTILQIFAIYFSKFCQKMVMMIFQKIYLGISSVMQERTVRNNIPHPADFISFQFVFEDLMVAKRLRVRPTAFWQFFSTYNWLIWCPNILLNKSFFLKSVNQKCSYIIHSTLSFSLGLHTQLSSWMHYPKEINLLQFFRCNITRFHINLSFYKFTCVLFIANVNCQRQFFPF